MGYVNRTLGKIIIDQPWCICRNGPDQNMKLPQHAIVPNRTQRHALSTLLLLEDTYLTVLLKPLLKVINSC